MALDSTHEIWDWVRKIKKSQLRLLIAQIIEEYPDTFYERRIPALSKYVSGKYGWDICKELCERVEDIRIGFGNGAMDYDILFTLALIGPVGIANFMSDTKDESNVLHKGCDVYLSVYWKQWTVEWGAEITKRLRNLSLLGSIPHSIGLGIKNIGKRVTYWDFNDPLIDNEVVVFLTVYMLTVRYK